MSERHQDLIRPRLFYCFVDFGHNETSWPVYVMPSKDVARYLTLSYQEWLRRRDEAARSTTTDPGCSSALAVLSR